jgi:hypothetical protein
MFTIHCPQHGAEVLLPERRIEALVNTDLGIEVHYRCWCGYEGSFLTGRSRRAQPAVA